MVEQERGFKGVWIPREVWLDTRLNMLEKGILTEVDSLDMSESGCFASNKHIAKFCQCSETKVSTAISKLVKLGYLYVQFFDGRSRILKSNLSKFERQTFKNEKADFQNVKQSNTSNNPNNKTDIPLEGEKRKRFTPPTLEEVKSYCLERRNNVDANRFVDYYTSNGWQVGKNKMRDWKAAVRTWERNGIKDEGQNKNSSYDIDDFWNAALENTYGTKKGANTPRAALDRATIARMDENAKNEPKTVAQDEALQRRADELRKRVSGE